MTQDLRDGPQHFGSIRECAELGETSSWAVLVLYRYFDDAKALVQRVQSQVSFNLKSFDQYRIVLDQPPAHDPVTAHDVNQIGAEQIVDQTLHQAIAKSMQRSSVFLLIVTLAVAVSYHHVGLVFEARAHELTCLPCRVGHVGVRQNVEIRLYIHKGAPHCVALSLPVFIDHPSLAFDVGECMKRYLVSSVGRLVVYDVDFGFW